MKYFTSIPASLPVLAYQVCVLFFCLTHFSMAHALVLNGTVQADTSQAKTVQTERIYKEIYGKTCKNITSMKIAKTSANITQESHYLDINGNKRDLKSKICITRNSNTRLIKGEIDTHTPHKMVGKATDKTTDRVIDKTADKTAKTKAPIITDKNNKIEKINKQNLRIIALGAPAVEIICALGFESNIVARAVWDTWPPAIKKLPHVGDPANPNIELILQLKPDIIFVDGHFNHMEKKLKQCGIKIVSVSAYYAKDVIPCIKKIAKILNAEHKGLQLENNIIYLRTLVSTRIKNIPNENLQAGLSITGHANYFSFSKKSGYSFLEDSGAINVVGDFEHPYPTLSREWLLFSDLDFLHISIDTNAYTKNEMENTLKDVWEITRKQGNMSQLSAVKKGNLFILSQELSYGLRSAIGNIYLAKALHPSLFTDINPDDINAEFTKKYFNMEMQGKRIYP